jgi:L-aspartate oxidase
MWTNASIVRNTKSLEMTLEKIEGYLKLNVGRLLFLRLLTAKAILKSALQRKESLGAHYLENN